MYECLPGDFCTLFPSGIEFELEKYKAQKKNPQQVME